MASKSHKKSETTATTTSSGPGKQVSSSERPGSPLSPSHLQEIRNLSVQIEMGQESVTRVLDSIKRLYENELSDARRLLDETAKDRDRLQIESNKLQSDCDHLKNALQSKEEEIKQLRDDYHDLLDTKNAMAEDLSTLVKEMDKEKSRYISSKRNLK